MMKKYGKPTRPKVNMEKFLLTMPCVKCGEKCEHQIRLANGKFLPIHGPCYSEIPLAPENRSAMENLAHDLDLMGGDHIACATIIAKRRKEIFG